MKTITITEDYNYFGDSVFTFLGEDYSFYRYNCRDGKDLIEAVKKQTAPVFIAQCIEMIHETRVIFKPALPVLEQMLATYEAVASQPHSFRADGAGAEIAGQYGY